MDDQFKEFLNRLAEAVLPLPQWLATTPAQRENVLAKWREPFSPLLSVRDLGLIDFVLRRIDDSDSDEQIARRWERIERDPLNVFGTLPGKGVAWRQARGMAVIPPALRFGIVESENVEVILDVPAHRASSRREFYGHAFAAFRQVAAAQPSGDWTGFAERLLKDDASLGWPPNCPASASRFMRQFVRDILSALIGMRDRPESHRANAVLAELGEHRRVGNSYAPETVRASVSALQLEIDKA